MSKITVNVYSSAEQLDRKLWDSIVEQANGSAFYRKEWLKAYELGSPGRNQAFHFVALFGETPIGIMPVYLTQGCPRLFAHHSILIKDTPNLKEPMLLAHSFYSYYGGPLVTSHHDEVYEVLIDEIKTLAGQLHVQVFGFVNLRHEDTHLIEILTENGFAVKYISSSMYLPIRYHSMEEYLQSLPKKRRSEFKRLNKKSITLGVSSEWLSAPYDINEVFRLTKSVFNQHGHIDSDLYPKRFLNSLINELEHYKKFLLIKSPSDELICFFLVLDDGKKLIPWIAGINYNVLQTYEPYYYGYYWIINHAINNNYHEIDMGRGSYIFKRRLGFQRRPLYLALAATHANDSDIVKKWVHDLSERTIHRHQESFPTTDRPHVL